MNGKKSSSIVYFILALLGLSLPVAALFLVNLGILAIILLFFGMGLNAVVVCLLYRETSQSIIVYLILALLGISFPIVSILLIDILGIFGVLLFFGGLILNATLVSILFSQALKDNSQSLEIVHHVKEEQYCSACGSLIGRKDNFCKVCGQKF